MANKKNGNKRVTEKKGEEAEVLQFDLDSLTGRETILFEKITGKSIMSLRGIAPDNVDPDNPDPEAIAESGLTMEVMLAFAFLVKRRVDPELDWDAFIDEPIDVSIADIEGTSRPPLDPINASDS